jgi:hypothetical protein
MAKSKAGEAGKGRTVFVIPRRQPEGIGELQPECSNLQPRIGKAEEATQRNTDGPEDAGQSNQTECELVGAFGIQAKEKRP